MKKTDSMPDPKLPEMPPTAELRAYPRTKPPPSPHTVSKPTVLTRPEQEAQRWKDIRKGLAHSLTTNGTLTGAPAPTLLQIEAGFTFVAQPEDTDFSYLHIEPLIDQASDLLDRGIRDRATYDELAAKMLLLNLELVEFSELDAIHQQEEAAGYYDVTRLQSQADYISELSNGNARRSYADQLHVGYVTYFGPAAYAAQWSAVGESAWTVGLISYSLAGQGAGTYLSAYSNGQPGWPPTPITVPQLSLDASLTQFYRSPLGLVEA
jgi:hypothetical protein